MEKGEKQIFISEFSKSSFPSEKSEGRIRNEEFQREKIGELGYLNENCWLVKNLNYAPYKRCQYCELKFHQCPFLHYQTISLLLVLFFLTLSFLVEGKISEVLIISVFTLVIVYGYFFNKSTNNLIQSYFAQIKAIKATHEEKKRREDAEIITVRERTLKEEAERLAREKERLAEQFQLIAIKSTAFKNSAEELAAREKSLRKEAENLLKVKSYFYMMASHHLLTPASQILGLTSLALEGSYGKIPPKLRNVIKDVSEANAKSIRLANQMLVVTQFELGKIEPNFKEVSLERIIEPLLKEFEERAKKKNLYLTFERPKETLPKAFVDVENIQNALRNLFENAILYTQKGGIKISVERKENSLLIAIKDTGAGIEKEEQSILFEGFAKGKAGFLYWMQGAGLGLYISKKYISLNKGKIWAESEGKNKGSTFYIELPIIM
ncbi:HAMP domain-containing histidine kinase [Patescibacteria group bacterium]|nr:HAMP domain-containing histidine kinase [Patescibacteria group bacterium]